MQAGQLFLATVALIVLSTVPDASAGRGPEFTQHVSLWLALLLIVMYVLGLVFSLKTHREFFGAAAHQGDYHEPWPMSVALATLVVVTVPVALVSHVFVASVQEAAEAGNERRLRWIRRRRNGWRRGGDGVRVLLRATR